MVYHLWYATDLKSNRRHATSHRLHYRVWQVLVKRRYDEHVGRIVYIHQLTLVLDIPQREGRQRELGDDLIGTTAKYGYHRVFLHLRITFSKERDGLDEIGHAFALHGNPLGNK